MKALIVDDDRTLADLLAFTLRRAGFEPYLAHDAASAVELFNQKMVDIVVLDVNMPGAPGLKNGFDVCRHIRQNSTVPIILLTVRDDEEDIIKGLNIGADDYILKPFSPRQLVARVQTILRRTGASGGQNSEPYQYEDLSFDPNLRLVTRNGKEPVSLTRLEARLLGYFLLNSGQVLLTENLIDHVWGLDGGSGEMLRQLVRRLRVKIEQDPGEPALIINLPGVGYGLGI